MGSQVRGALPSAPTILALLVKWYNDGFVIRSWQFDSVKGHQIHAGVAQLVEHLPSKQDVASSRLVSRSILFRSSKLGVGGGLLIHEAWFESRDRSHNRKVGREV